MMMIMIMIMMKMMMMMMMMMMMIMIMMILADSVTRISPPFIVAEEYKEIKDQMVNYDFSEYCTKKAF